MAMGEPVDPVKVKRRGAIVGIFILGYAAIYFIKLTILESWAVYLPLFLGTLFFIRHIYHWGFK
tara:strand:+ start:39 stop:230 length:192 start_codon:yes stop_codon:yes gene_type:complete